MCKRGSDVQVAAEHGLQQIVTVNFADEGAGSLVCGDIGGIFGQDIAHQLIDRIVALFLNASYTCCTIS